MLHVCIVSIISYTCDIIITERRKIFVDSIDNIIYNINPNYEKYKNKIISFVNDNNIDQFAKEIFIKPNIIISMICRRKVTDRSYYSAPLLYFIGAKQNSKMFELFLNCLFHFKDIFLNNNKSFLKKYFNFRKLDSPIIAAHGEFVKFYLYILYI